jgi:NADH dehydrogenase/NADH:ubiquinone oxidoreductase subunit G
VPEYIRAIINGKEVKAKKGRTILEIAKDEGIYIPTLCTHKLLSPYGACRVCVVEVEGVQRLLTSCNTELKDGMIINTDTERVKRARREIVEFMLSEHPSACLLCPYQEECYNIQHCNVKLGTVVGCRFCAKDGICELQKVVRELGIKEISLPSVYRGIPPEKDDPFFERDYNLCILCGRCVRICQEVRMTGTLSFLKRGPSTKVGTLFDISHLEAGCEFCGSCVDVCPTGALVERTRKWKGVPDERINNTCPFCSMNCDIIMDVKKKEVFSVSSTEEGLLCSSGKFGIVGMLLSKERTKSPLIKEKGEVSWEEALSFVSEILKSHKEDEIGMVLSPSLTNETISSAISFAESMGITKITSPALRWEGSIYSEILLNKKPKIPSYDLLIVSTQLPAPLEIEVKHLSADGGDVYEFNPSETFLTRHVNSFRCIPEPSFVPLMLLKAIREKSDKKLEIDNILNKVDLKTALSLCGISEGELDELIEGVKKAKKKAFIYDINSIHPFIIKVFSEVFSIDIIPVTKEGNERGLIELSYEMMPYDKFLSDEKIKVVYSIGVPYAGNGKKTILQDPFLVSQNGHWDVFLPVLSYTEENGTYTNLWGKKKKLTKISEPDSGAFSDVKIMEEILKKLGKSLSKKKVKSRENKGKKEGFSSITLPSIKKEDEFYIYPKTFTNFFRGFELHSTLKGFKRIMDGEGIYMNESDANRLNLKDGERVVLKTGEERTERVLYVKRDLKEGVVEIVPSYKEMKEILSMKAKGIIPKGKIER